MTKLKMVKATPLDVEAQVIPLHQQIVNKKRELEVLEAQMDNFKSELMKTLDVMGVDSIKKGGYTFSKVQKKVKVFDHVKMEGEILDARLPMEHFLKIDTDAFEKQFPESSAITKIDGTKYLSIRKA